MDVGVDESLRLAVDCVATLSDRLVAVYGWAATERQAPTELAVTAGAAGDCAIEHCSFHPRPDLARAAPPGTVVTGFTLLVATPPRPQALALLLHNGWAHLSLDLMDGSLETEIRRATAARDGGANFALLSACAEDAALAPLRSHAGLPYGVFQDWIDRLPLVRGRAAETGGVAEIEALASPAGEILLMLRDPDITASAEETGAVLLGGMAGDGGEAIVLPLADSHKARLPGAVALYGRVESAWMDRLDGVEVIVQARLRRGRQGWLRCLPARVPAAGMLEAIRRGAAEAEAEGAHAFLRQVISRREAAFLPALAALAALPPRGTGSGASERLGLLLGADDGAAARLFQVDAAAFEQRCDTMLVLGEAAAEVAEVFARRGRVAVASGPHAWAALRNAAGRSGVLAVDAVRYAEAVAAGRGAAAFPPLLDAAQLARLLALHAVAGSDDALAGSLARLGAARPQARVAEDPVERHIDRLWDAGGRGGGVQHG